TVLGAADLAAAGLAEHELSQPNAQRWRQVQRAVDRLARDGIHRRIRDAPGIDEHAMPEPVDAYVAAAPLHDLLQYEGGVDEGRVLDRDRNIGGDRRGDDLDHRVLVAVDPDLPRLDAAGLDPESIPFPRAVTGCHAGRVVPPRRP